MCRIEPLYVSFHVKSTDELSILSPQDEMEGLDLEGKRVVENPEAVQCSDSSSGGFASIQSFIINQKKTSVIVIKSVMKSTSTSIMNDLTETNPFNPNVISVC